VDDAEGASSFDFKDTDDFALDDYAGFSFYQTNAGHKEKVPTPIQEPDTNSQDGKDDHWDENEGHSFHQGRKVNEDIILLDNQSTHTTFYNRKLMKNIRPAPIPLRMLANGGDITYDQIGDVAGYGTGYYNKNGIANILSMAEAEAMGHEITYTPGCFTMTNCVSNRDTKFHRTPAGLYAHKVKRGVSLIQTVAENEAEFTPRQVEKAKEARDLYAMIGRPSYRDYLAIIKNDLLPNAKITPSDVERAEKIYGKDLGAIQGKTTRQTPNSVSTDYINIPADILTNHRTVTLAADILFVGGIAFLITTSRNIQFTTVEKLPNREAHTLALGLVKVVNLYKRRGFNMGTCLMDNEFEVLRGPLLEQNIALNTCAPGEHVPEIERKIRTVKERVRGVITTLPFKIIPNLLIVHAVIFSVMWLNFFPPTGGVSQTLSPQTIVTGLKANNNRHCRIPFGAYAQVHAEPDPTNNAMVSRTVGGISLGPTGNIQGTHKFLSLLTGRQIQARAFTPLPMPIDIVGRVEAFAPRNQNGVTFGDRNGNQAEESWQEENDPAEEYLESNEYDFQDEEDINLPANVAGIDGQELHDLEEGTNQQEMDDHEDHNEMDPTPIGDPGVGPEPANNPEPNPGEVPGVDPETAHEAEPQHVQQTEDKDDLEDEIVFQYPGLSDDDDEGYFTAEQEALEDDVEVQQDTKIDHRVHTTTRSGRRVKMGKALFEDYETSHVFHQAEISPSSQTPSVRQAFGIKSDKMRLESPGNDAILQYAFTQYSLKQGLRKFPTLAKEATIAEMRQLHDMNVFQPVRKSSLTRQEILQTLGSIIFIKEKRCGRIKARACADGRPQRLLYDKSEASSPTVKTESVFLTAVIDAQEGREVAVYDIPGAFLHSTLPDVVHMKVCGDLARLLIYVDPGIYTEYIEIENGKEVIYLLLTRALYGCLKSALQFWKHLSGNLVKNGYTLNRYDPCVANKDIGGSQMTIIWHVDDLKISHASGEMIDKEVAWLETIYGPLVGSRGKQHTYLGMDMDFRSKGVVEISMVPYLQEIIEEFPEDLGKAAATPAASYLFDESENPVLLSEERARVFHHTVAKILWAAMRARPDLLTAMSFLTSKVRAPDEDDMKKLTRTLSYIRNTVNLPLALSADGPCVIKWWVDASFATRRELRSQTGVAMSMGRGAIHSMARKQRLNTTSSTEAEVVGADDAMPQITWTRYFLEEQGVKISRNILLQDNQSAMLLEKNGTGSSSRRTRHINIRFFFIKDRISNGEVELEYCPTDQMVGDYFTKPLQGAKFHLFRRIIMGEVA